MAKANTYEWEKGWFVEGNCDIPNCKEKVMHRRFFYPTYMNGDAECEASLCEQHKEYKQFNTTAEIIKAFNRKTNVKNQ